MATGGEERPDPIWVEQPPNELVCAICKDVATEPQKHGGANGCGKVFCKHCINEDQRTRPGNTQCPCCRQTLTLFQDPKSAQQINALQLNCNNLDHGCEWTGELRHLKEHLIGCLFAKLYCPYKCGQQLQRKEIKIHTLHCPEHHRYKVQFYDQLSFIQPIDVFQITSASRYYHCDSLGLSIEAPEGIIPRGSVLPLKIGMCLHGPFKFSKHCTPIAPILMIRPPKDVCLLKPLKITIPLIITEPNDSDVKALGIQVVKTDHATEDCTFEELDESCTNLKLHSRNGFGYAAFSISHFCFISVRANNSSEVIKRSGYCIYPLYSHPSTGVTYHLCVTYFTEPCITAIEQQFPKDKYELKTADIRRFTFRGPEPYIEASIKTVGSEGKAYLQSANPDTGAYRIKAESIDLWRKTLDELKLEIKTLVYPPSFRIYDVNHKATAMSLTVTIQFKTNQVESDNFYMTLIQPLPSNSDSTSASPKTEGTSIDREITQSDVPHLAGYFDNVDLYLDCCGLTLGQQTDVKEAKHSSGNHVAMIKCLTIWRTTNPKAATFRALLDFVVCLRKGEIARQIRQYISA